MNKIEVKKNRRTRTKFRVRKKINGTALKPRISIFRSNRFFYVQAIDDENGVTLVSASSVKIGNPVNVEISKKVGVELANALKDKKIEEAVLDRNGFIYTGKIKAFTDALRENGIKI